jgi:hypothetical protein
MRIEAGSVSPAFRPGQEFGMIKLITKLVLWLGMLIFLAWGLDQAYPYMPHFWQKWVLEKRIDAMRHLRKTYDSVSPESS